MNKRIKELLNYIVIDSTTRIIDFGIYFFILTLMVNNWLLATIGSWLVAVSFSFWANRNFAFESINDAGKVAYEFFLGNFFSLVIGIILLLLLIYFYDYNIYSAKMIVNVIIFFFGYILCELKNSC